MIIDSDFDIHPLIHVYMHAQSLSHVRLFATPHKL